jgi:hypothetical protein
MTDRPRRRCYQMFTPRVSKGKGSEFCTKECFGASCRKPAPILQCLTCLQIFAGKSASDNRKYCSKRCSPFGPKKSRLLCDGV